MGYILGLDMGIASLGYAVLRTDNSGVPFKIITLDSVIFTQAEHPKTGESLAKPRRLARGQRRLTRRRSFRKDRIKRLFIDAGILDAKEIAAYLSKEIAPKDIWALRVKALDEKISDLELFAVLYYLAGHRGFKSTRRSDAKDEQQGKVISALSETTKALIASNARTFGEYVYNSDDFADHKHNKAYVEGYKSTPKRDWILQEARQIITEQNAVGNDKMTVEFMNNYLDILNSQRNFDMGPGKGSPFGGNLIEKMIGNDTLDPTQKRAAKATYSFQHFNFLSTLSSLKISRQFGAPYTDLTVEERATITDKLWGNFKTAKLTYKQLRKLLNLSDDARFNLVRYSEKKDPIDSEDKSTFAKIDSLRKIQAALSDSTLESDIDLLNNVGTILTTFKSDDNRREELTKLGLNFETIDRLLPLNFSAFGKLSQRTMDKISPFLSQGMVYSEAATAAGFDFQNSNIDLNYIRDNVKNPVVQRSIKVAVKVINTITREYGRPDAIHIELARELSKNFADRKNIEKTQENNRLANEKIADRLRDLNVPVNGINILKERLFEEQSGIDPYNLTENAAIDHANIFQDDYYEIDHIIPYSLSLDDSYLNKVLTATRFNREKRNRIPLDYLGTDEQKVEIFKNRVANNFKNPVKRRNLLVQTAAEKDVDGWRKRNLNDTRYMTSLLRAFIENNVKFTDTVSKGKRVVALSGGATAKIRSRWGITKVRAASDLHHAVDAVVIACITPRLIQAVSTFAKYQETKNVILSPETWAQEIDATGEEIKQFRKTMNEFPLPWPDFRNEVIDRVSEDPAAIMGQYSWEYYSPEEIETLSQPFVIRVPNHKVTGEATAATVYSKKDPDSSIYMHRVPITALKLKTPSAKSVDQIQRIVSGTNEYRLEEDGGNKLIYTALFDALIANDGDGAKAFTDGYVEVNGTKVRKVKVYGKITSAVQVGPSSYTTQSKMVRIDVYQTPKKYVFVPIYTSDVVAKKLPDQAVTRGKSRSEWYKITEADKFMFSLYRNDLIAIANDKPINVTAVLPDGSKEKQTRNLIIGYYTGADISTGSISLDAPDRSFSARSIGITKLTQFKKMRVNYLGEVTEETSKKPILFHQ